MKRFKYQLINHTPCVVDSFTNSFARFETISTARNTTKRFNQHARMDVSGYIWNPLTAEHN